MTEPVPHGVVDLDAYHGIQWLRVIPPSTGACNDIYLDDTPFVLALIERLRALEGGGNQGVSLAREPSHAHNAAREADASTLVSDAAGPAAWQCPFCPGTAFARVEELQPSGGFDAGPMVRCIECKSVTYHEGVK